MADSVAIHALRKTLADVAATVERFGGKGLTEQDTKHALIAPVLDALGWLTSDLDLVRAEYRHTSKDNPIDYALFSAGRPVLLVEAKALDGTVADHKVLTQMFAYALTAEVSWALVTNGRLWDLYRVFEKAPAEEKRLFSLDVSDPNAAEWLSWIVPSRLAGNDLDKIWRHRFAERRVRTRLQAMLLERDSDLVALLASRTGLSTPDVTAGLCHLNASFGEPEPGPLGIEDPAPMLVTARTPSEVPLSGFAPSVAAATPLAAGPAAESAAGDAPSPAAGSKPTSFSIGAETWPVRSWRDLPARACHFLAATRAREFAAAFDSSEFQGRKRRLLSRSSEGMTAAMEVPGGFVEGNFSGPDCVDLMRRLLSACGIDPATARFSSS